MAIWRGDYFKNDYDFYLTNAWGMSLETLKDQIQRLLNLSDDPEETMFTGEMQLQFAAFQEILGEKQKRQE